ncbi:MAG: ATP-dependent DNA ligase [Methanobrevibacter sp.]|jgi:DNA ligase-1|nr:ATP-dependent DNA ligase [Candidatus Methanovirga basalitermitum]
MKYKKLVDVYEALSQTTKKLEKTAILTDLFKGVDSENIGKVILMSLGLVYPKNSEEEQGIGDKLLMKAISQVFGVSISKIEDNMRKFGDIGQTTEELYKKKTQQTFLSKELTVKFVFNSIRKIAMISGDKSQSRKIAIISEILSSASGLEAKYISKTILEELRLGVGEAIVRNAISDAFEIDKKVTERAYMLTNDLGLVGEYAKEKGVKGLKELNLIPGRPVKPMLAQLSLGIDISIKEMGNAICETKYDGIRVQIHKKGDEIKFFTRKLENITNAFPEMIEPMRTGFPDENFIVEGEMIATRNEKPISFQYILHRVRRKHDIDKAIENVPLTLYLFDALYYQNPLIDKPLNERRKTLEQIIKPGKKINLSTKIDVNMDNIAEAEKLFKDSVSNGHEGIMIKNPNEPYIPGTRGKKMLKFKAEPETLDVIVTGGTYGLGRRSNFIGSYLIALKSDDNELKTVAHVATGLDDETLEYLTNLMEKYKKYDKGTKIFVEPRIILEIAYSEIVKSPDYEAGYSLRFPVVKRIRNDKGIDEINTVKDLEAMFKS